MSPVIPKIGLDEMDPCFATEFEAGLVREKEVQIIRIVLRMLSYRATHLHGIIS